MLKFKSEKTSRGPLSEGWRDDTQPIMCSYKLVDVRFDMNKMSLLTLILFTWCSFNTPCHCVYVLGRVFALICNRLTGLGLS